MARPPRLKSELDAASPVTARPPANTEPPPDHRASGAPASSTPAPDSTAVPAQRVVKRRVGPYLAEAQADRLRACYIHGWLQDHRGTFSDMLEELLLAGARQIENERNNGKPWPPITAGAIKSVSQMNIEAERRTTSS